MKLIDPSKSRIFQNEATLPSDLEKVFHAKFKDDVIPFNSNYFDAFSKNNPDSSYSIGISSLGMKNGHVVVNPEQWELATTFPLNNTFSTPKHNVCSVELHQQFLINLTSYVFGIKQIDERFFYYTGRYGYDAIKQIRIRDGVAKTLVPYLQDGYVTKGDQWLIKEGEDSIAVVWDHYNYPEPYIKKLLIYCIKHLVWPKFNIFLQEAVYPTGKVIMLPKKVHDNLGKSKDDNRGTMYQDAGIEVCEYFSPYKEKSNLNIWTTQKQKHLVSQSRLDV